MGASIQAAAATLLLAGYASSALAYSAIASIEKLVKDSQIIVLGDVKAVEVVGTGQAQQRVARIRVLQTWKGNAASELKFIASPGWFMCDTSHVRVGEKVVLFLSRDVHEPGQLRITHFGRGRLPIGDLNGTEVAFVYEVIFPSSIAVHRETAYPRREAVSLSAMRAVVARLVSGSAG
jgi:hypothetical protein